MSILMSYCRLWTASWSLFSLFPELFFFFCLFFVFFYFSAPLSVLVTHCLESGNVYVSAGLAEVREESMKPSFFVWLSSTAALLLLTDNTWVVRGGERTRLGRGRPSERQRAAKVSWCRLKMKREMFCFHQKCVTGLLDQVFTPEISLGGTSDGKWKETQHIGGSLDSVSGGLLSALCVFVYVVFVLDNWLGGCFFQTPK